MTKPYKNYGNIQIKHLKEIITTHENNTSFYALNLVLKTFMDKCKIIIATFSTSAFFTRKTVVFFLKNNYR